MSIHPVWDPAVHEGTQIWSTNIYDLLANEFGAVHVMKNSSEGKKKRLILVPHLAFGETCKLLGTRSLWSLE